ncbi:MAG: hypothetical protein R3F31_08125 [Verrucomicrobiales bacterium]
MEPCGNFSITAGDWGLRLFRCPVRCLVGRSFPFRRHDSQRFLGGREVWLPSGCGIIRESRFDREWRELALKRNSVKALLGV